MPVVLSLLISCVGHDACFVGQCSCSGDDAIQVSGSACPTLQRCNFSGKKCGLLASGSTKTKLERCSISGCGRQACKAMDHASVQMIRYWFAFCLCSLCLHCSPCLHMYNAPCVSCICLVASQHADPIRIRAGPISHGSLVLFTCNHRCSLEKHEEECIVGTDTSNIDLTDCSMYSSQGPAVDMSGTSKLRISRGGIKECAGGLSCQCLHLFCRSQPLQNPKITLQSL